MKLRFFLSSFLWLAQTLFSAPSEERVYANVAVQAVQIQLEDLLHKIHCLEADIRLLEERLALQEIKIEKEIAISQEVKGKKDKDVEKKVAFLEEKQEKVVKDIHQISSHANEMAKSFLQVEEKMQSLENRLKDVSKIKTTLDGVAKKLKEGADDSVASNSSSHGAHISQNNQGNIYKVKAGDSLEKIAKLNKVSIEAIKKANRLEKDKIMIGQELKLP
jgi:LysM repeat protein